ncbi:MAG: amidase [Geminicoccaceae bacterium]|nr:amidase [Geminicoccaceae bacterium]
MSGVLELSATALASAIRAGEVSSLEATQASLDAFAREGGADGLNAVVEIDGERALDIARACDAEQARGRLRGPLHGVPMAHKDMFYRAGRPCASGTRRRAGFVPEVTATVLDRLDAAGAVDCGRLNMVEFALGITGHNPITGHPRNPWDRAHVTGGSSSGPVASVAARLTWASLGSDTGGSIRIPAAFTNLVGLKPTYGRISRFGCLPLSQSLDHIGPLTRTAADAALLLSVLAGADDEDRLSARHPVPDYVRELEQNLECLRVGFVEPPYGVEVSEEVVGRMAETRRVLTDLGASPVPVTLPPLDDINALRRTIMLAEAAGRHHPWVMEHGADYNPQTLARMRAGFDVDAVSYLRACSYRSVALERFVAGTMEGIDMLLTPVMPQPAPPIEATDTGGDAAFIALSNAIGHFIFAYNYLGLPAIAVPVEPSAGGLPLAIQLVARPFQESLLLRAAHWMDEATGYSRRRPPSA